MEDQGLSASELIGIVRRRLLRMVLVSAAVLAVAVPVALYWPPVFRSTATILIEEQEIPRDLVRSTITTFADERIQVISQQVMTRGTLMQIVEKFNLYERERKRMASEEILERMRRDIKLETVSANVTDRRSGLRSASTIAFKLSFDSESPASAQRVANELVTLYLNENLRTRQQRSRETSAFLADEAQRLAKQISEIEAKLAVFKRENAGRLPELMALNMNLRDRAEAELVEIERQIRLSEDRAVYLEAQLTVVKQAAPLPTGERALEPEERLKLLRNQYAGLSGVYAEGHPDLQRIRREMDALQKSTGTAALPDPKRIDEARAELKRLQDRYAEAHPDVVRQRKMVESLEASPPPERKPDNPAYVSLASQIESARSEAASLRLQRVNLRTRLAGYTVRLEETPGVEQAYRDLSRDHENANTKYKEIRAKQMEAEVSNELEKDRKGERFSLIDPPQFPEKPNEPNRKKLLALGLMASLGGGVGAAALAEALDRSVKSARALAALLDAPLLGVVPRAADPNARRRRRWLLLAVLGLLLLGGLAMLAGLHFFYMPLDSLYYVLLRRLQL